MLQLLYVPPVEEALNVDLLPEVDLSLPLELVHPWSGDDVEELSVNILSFVSWGSPGSRVNYDLNAQ